MSDPTVVDRSDQAGETSQVPGEPAEPAARSGCASVVHASSTLVFALVGCLAILAIALVLGAYGYTQLGPGGMLSDVRPGQPAPEFHLPTIDDGEVKLSDYRGQPVIVNFWATYCRRCVEELPALAEATERHAKDGVVLITINPRQRRAHVEEYLADRGIDIPVAFDAGDATWRRYRIVSLPTTVFINRQGIVQSVELEILTPEIIDRRVAEIVGD